MLRTEHISFFFFFILNTVFTNRICTTRIMCGKEKQNKNIVEQMAKKKEKIIHKIVTICEFAI